MKKKNLTFFFIILFFFFYFIFFTCRYDVLSPAITYLLENNPPFVIYDLMEKLPFHPVTKLTTSRELAFLSGPGDSSAPIQHYGTIACGKSISNFPKVNGKPYREGDPICDRFFIKLYENRVIVAVGDAQHWGISSRKASKRAVKHFISFLEEQAKVIVNLRCTGPVLLSALATAHSRINDSEQSGKRIRATSLLGGVLLETDNEIDIETIKNSGNIDSLEVNQYPFVFVFVSVGDCKCYRYSPEDNTLTDLSKRESSQGSIGGRGEPDLSNCDISYIPCKQDDLIIILTSGVSDNFNPNIIGTIPPNYSLMSDSEKIEFCTSKATNLIHRVIGDAPTVTSTVESILNHTREITRISREYMEANSSAKLSPDRTIHPGSMDHATCVCFKVGRVTLSYEDWISV